MDYYKVYCFSRVDGKHPLFSSWIFRNNHALTFHQSLISTYCILSPPVNLINLEITKRPQSFCFCNYRRNNVWNLIDKKWKWEKGIIWTSNLWYALDLFIVHILCIKYITPHGMWYVVTHMTQSIIQIICS